MSTKPKILVTNDDGIFSPGISALDNSMREIGETFVVAPDSEQSAVGHAITISDPLRVKEVERNGNFFGWAVNGTPADCVKLAIKAILNFEPDLIVSGINHGPNTAINAIYSGTVSAATEGTFMGIPSIAFSLTSFKKFDLTFPALISRTISEKVLNEGLPEGTLLNVNIPAIDENQIKGIKITRQGRGRYEEFFEKRIDPMNRTYYWLGGKKLFLDTEKDVDEVAIKDNYISVTPLQYDLTDHSFIKKLKNWEIEI